MALIVFAVLAAVALGAFLAARARARVRSGAAWHSGPVYHAVQALIWTLAPALLVLVLAAVFSDALWLQVMSAGLPEPIQALEPFRRFPTSRG